MSRDTVIRVYDTQNEELGPGEQLHTDFFRMEPESRCRVDRNANNLLQEVTYFAPWRPSRELAQLLLKFNNVILKEHHSNPCSFCGRLLTPSQTKWLCYDPFFRYPLQRYFPGE